MNWTTIIADIRGKRVTLQDIADKCGFASKGHVHDLATGKQQRVLWEVGDALIKMHRRVMRRKA